MKTALRKTLKISGIVLGAVVILVLAAVLLAVFDKPLVRNIVQRQLGKGAGSTARVGGLAYSLAPFRITITSLELGREDPFQKMSVSLTRLEARGSFWKLVRGVRPALEAIEADGVSLRLEQKAVSEKPLDIEKSLIQVSDTLAWSKTIAVTNARLSISLLAQDIDIENLDLTLTPGPARDAVTYAIGRGDVSVKGKGGALLFAAGLASSGSLGLVSPFSLDSSFALSAPRFSVGGIEDSFEKLSLTVAGSFNKSAQELNLSRLKIDIPGLLDLEGTATGRVGHGLFLEAKAGAKLESLAAAVDLLGPRLPAGLRAAALSGQADLTGTYALQRSDQGSKDNLSGTLTLDSLELTPVVAGRPLRVRASGRIDVTGPTSDPRLSSDIHASLGRMTISGLTVASSDIHLVGSGSRSSADISRLDARLAGLAFEAAEGKTIAFNTAALTAKGTYDLVRKAGVLTALEARLARPRASSAGRRVRLGQKRLFRAPARRPGSGRPGAPCHRRAVHP